MAPRRARGDRARRGRLGLVRGGLASTAACSRSRSTGCPRSSTACASRTSRTSTSGSPRAGAARPRGACDWVVGAASGSRLRHGRPRVAASRGWPSSRSASASSRRCFVVLGNHDFADSRDPFSQPIDAGGDRGSIEGVTVLIDQATEVELRGRRCSSSASIRELCGSRCSPGGSLIDEARLRILLCHFPRIVWRIPGAIPARALRALPRGPDRASLAGRQAPARSPACARRRRGLPLGDTVLHVSPGLGTTFVPFRLFARPEVTELVCVARTGSVSADRGR